MQEMKRAVQEHLAKTAEAEKQAAYERKGDGNRATRRAAAQASKRIRRREMVRR